MSDAMSALNVCHMRGSKDTCKADMRGSKSLPSCRDAAGAAASVLCAGIALLYVIYAADMAYARAANQQDALVLPAEMPSLAAWLLGRAAPLLVVIAALIPDIQRAHERNIRQCGPAQTSTVKFEQSSETEA